MSDPTTNPREAHQRMLEGHKQTKALRRERHATPSGGTSSKSFRSP